MVWFWNKWLWNPYVAGFDGPHEHNNSILVSELFVALCIRSSKCEISIFKESWMSVLEKNPKRDKTLRRNLWRLTLLKSTKHKRKKILWCHSSGKRHPVWHFSLFFLTLKYVTQVKSTRFAKKYYITMTDFFKIPIVRNQLKM